MATVAEHRGEYVGSGHDAGGDRGRAERRRPDCAKLGTGLPLGRACGVGLRKPPGRPPRMDARQKQQLAEQLLKTPAECGFADRHLWTQQLIADLISREFGVSYHHDHVGVILRAIGLHAPEADAPGPRAGRGEDRRVAARGLAGAFKKSADAGGVILMADEVGFMMTPSVKRTWATRACTPVVPYRNRRQKKVSVLGAVALHPASGAVDLLCDFHPDSYVRGAAGGGVPAPRAGRVSRATCRSTWCGTTCGAQEPDRQRGRGRANPRLTLHYLPPYAPDLNPAEGVWCLTKYHRMANHTIGEARRACTPRPAALGRRRPRPGLLRSCFEGAGLAVSLHRAQ